MIIVRRKADSVVVYTFHDNCKLFLTERGLIEADGAHYGFIKPDTHELLKVETPETIITDGAFTYIDGVWAVPDESMLSETVVVSKIQFLLSIHEEGLTDDVNTARDALGTKKQIRYDNGVIFKRRSNLIDNLVDEMPNTSADDMDLIFKRASQISDR